MKRRQFLKSTAPFLTIPVMLNGIPVSASTRSQMVNTFLQLMGETDRVLVLVQLDGGNDGLNTVIPLDQLSTYNSVRPDIALPEAKLLKITPEQALHPSLSEVNSMYQAGNAVIVNGVSYPNPNQSHFRATDIWMSGSEYNQYLSSGWVGRYLASEYPTYPDDSITDPPSLTIGAIMPLTMQGPETGMGIAITDPTLFYTIVNATKGGIYADPPNTRPGNELKFVREVEKDSQLFAATIKVAADKAPNKATYPTNTLADQLKIVARLIAGGLKTRIYMVRIGGFDTHAGQVEATDKTTGAHATLLKNLSSSVGAFYDDLKQLGAQDRVLTMTFSEFGRRVASNASDGSDHGTAAPLFVFGTNVKGGVIGKNPSLTDLDNGDLKMVNDFRQVYTSILAQWFNADKATLDKSVLKDFTQLPIIKTLGVEAEDFSQYFKLTNYPNPVNGVGTTISYNLPRSAEVSVRVLDLSGKSVANLVAEHQSAGDHSVHFTADRLPSGTYMYELRAGKQVAIERMVVER